MAAHETSTAASRRFARRILAGLTACSLAWIIWRSPAWLKAGLALEMFLRSFGGPASSLATLLPGLRKALRAGRDEWPGAGERATDLTLLAMAVFAWILASGSEGVLLSAVLYFLMLAGCLYEAGSGRTPMVVFWRSRPRSNPGAKGVVARLDGLVRARVRSAMEHPATPARALMILVSASMAMLVVMAGLKLYARNLGIRTATYHNDLNYWREDPELGFVNRAHIDEYNYFVLRDRTDGRGFKRVKPFSTEKPAGVVRILAVGDSVTWGIGVDERQDFCGLLEEGLSRGGQYEVINGGVIGYSAWRACRFAEERVFPLDPDVLLINLCENDILPTHDPFNNLRGIHARYLGELLADGAISLTSEERADLGELQGLFGGESVWGSVAGAPEGVRRMALKALIEWPYQRLGERCAAKGIRLICLLIPPDKHDPIFESYVAALTPVFERGKIEFIDFRRALSTANEPSETRGVGSGLTFPFRWRDLETIQNYRRFEWIHREKNFIDYCHLSRKGHAVVAEQVQKLIQAGAGEMLTKPDR